MGGRPHMYPESIRFPALLPVRQHFPNRSIPDVRGEVLRQLATRQSHRTCKPEPASP
jgi:hypothetical protein